jgi:excisionase family DNA binding protein
MKPSKMVQVVKFLTVAQAAEALNLSPFTIRAWIARRQIGVVRLGRSVRIPVSEIERLTTQGTVPAELPPAA